MVPEIYIGATEAWVIGFLTLTGIMFILLGKSPEKPFIGSIVLGGLFFILYGHHCTFDEKEYLLKRFNEGKAIECGLWRGESLLIDPNNGWRWDKAIGFVKNDKIFNEPALCNVIAEEAPLPSSIPYWLSFITSVIILLLFRTLTLQKETSLEDESQPIDLEETPNDSNEITTKDESCSR